MIKEPKMPFPENKPDFDSLINLSAAGPEAIREGFGPTRTVRSGTLKLMHAQNEAAQ
jgi:hypothetical protein